MIGPRLLRARVTRVRRPDNTIRVLTEGTTVHYARGTAKVHTIVDIHDRGWRIDLADPNGRISVRNVSVADVTICPPLCHHKERTHTN